MSQEVPNTSETINAYYDVQVKEKFSRWRVFNFILAIPALIIDAILSSIFNIIYLATFVSVPFTGRVPTFFYDIYVALSRYRSRVYDFTFLFLSPYPRLELTPDRDDPGDYPVQLHYPRYSGSTPRWAPLNIIFLLPHYVMILMLVVGMVVTWIFSLFSAIIRGRLPRFFVRYVINFNTYLMRVSLYLYMINRNYPSFKLGRD